MLDALIARPGVSTLAKSHHRPFTSNDRGSAEKEDSRRSRGGGEEAKLKKRHHHNQYAQ